MTEIMISDMSYHDIYNLKPETFSLTNIAIALGNTCRWGGHLGSSYTKKCRPRGRLEHPEALVSNFYSVAEHSYLGAMFHYHREEEELAKLFLLHDAAEPFIGGDIPTPLKNELTKLNKWEKDIQRVILEAYDLPLLGFDWIRETDRRICRNEVIALYADKAEWAKNIEPLCVEKGFNRQLIELQMWTPEEAMNKWLDLAYELKLENRYVA